MTTSRGAEYAERLRRASHPAIETHGEEAQHEEKAGRHRDHQGEVDERTEDEVEIDRAEAGKNAACGAKLLPEGDGALGEHVRDRLASAAAAFLPSRLLYGGGGCAAPVGAAAPPAALPARLEASRSSSTISASRAAGSRSRSAIACVCSGVSFDRRRAHRAWRLAAAAAGSSVDCDQPGMGASNSASENERDRDVPDSHRNCHARPFLVVPPAPIYPAGPPAATRPRRPDPGLGQPGAFHDGPLMTMLRT